MTTHNQEIVNSLNKRKIEIKDGQIINQNQDKKIINKKNHKKHG